MSEFIYEVLSISAFLGVLFGVIYWVSGSMEICKYLDLRGDVFYEF